MILVTDTLPHGIRRTHVLSLTPLADITGTLTRIQVFERPRGWGILALLSVGNAKPYIGHGATPRAAATDALEQYRQWRLQSVKPAEIVADIASALAAWENANPAVPEEQID